MMIMNDDCDHTIIADYNNRLLHQKRQQYTLKNNYTQLLQILQIHIKYTYVH